MSMRLNLALTAIKFRKSPESFFWHVGVGEEKIPYTVYEPSINKCQEKLVIIFKI